MPTTTLAFLDRYHPDIYPAISRTRPEGWEAVYGEEKTFEPRAAAIADAVSTLGGGGFPRAGLGATGLGAAGL